MHNFLRKLLCLLVTLTLGRCDDTVDWASALTQAFQDLQATVEVKHAEYAEMAKQIMLDRYSAEDRIRMEGHSGLVGVRNYDTGFENFYASPYTERSFGWMNDYAHFVGPVAWGELAVVMNGVPFTTRHNVFSLEQPSTASTDWLATEPIAPPPIPATVTGDIDEQILEMQEYFWAFKTQNESYRDYKPYFKPVMCYLEGAWLSDAVNVAPEEQERFFVSKWMDLHEINHMTSHLGSLRNAMQKYSNLPRTIIGIDEFGVPIYAQWWYRIACFPFTMDDIPTDYLKLVDDLTFRVPREVHPNDLYYNRGARFKVDDLSEPGYHPPGDTVLDKLISQIPGLDNVPALLEDRPYIDRATFIPDGAKTSLNLGYYNHLYHDVLRDPFKKVEKHRGFMDPNMYVAINTQPEVAGMPVQFSGANIPDLRVSWMLPLEVIYLTPLLTWNPYNIPFFEGNKNEYPAKSVRDGRSGKENSPFNGTNSDTFVWTPQAFFDDFPMPVSGDLVMNDVFVLDSQGEKRRTSSSNTRTITGNIGNGVGPVRLRYPILPLHQEGSAVWKEVSALKIYMNEQLIQLSAALVSAMEGGMLDQPFGF